MKIEFSKNGDTLLVEIEGRLDTITSPELQASLTENLQDVDLLVFDCEKLAYISSAGLRVLLWAQKKMDGSMKLLHVGEVVMEVLEMTGFADVLVIE